MHESAARSLPPLEGQLVGERYLCLQPLWQRSEREVWRVEDTWARGVPRVLKVAIGTRTRDFEAHRLRQEFRVLSELSHPSIPRAHDFGADTTRGFSWLAIDEAPGAPLDIQRPIGAEDAIRVARAVLRALDLIHARRFVHLDVKPSNIMLDVAHRHVTLIDFDLCTWSDSAAGRGTFPFAAPEVVRGTERIGATADLYSLGITLYGVITGHLPPVGVEFAEGLDVGQDVPHRLRELVRGLTRARAFDRVPNARAALAALAAGEEGSAIETPEGVRARIDHPLFIGRAEELEILAAIGRRPRVDDPRYVACLVSGPGGSGLSRLIQRASREWVEEGARVAVIAPHPGRRSAIAPLLDLAARLTPGRGPMGSFAEAEGDQAAAGAQRLQLIRWLMLASRRRRLVLAFEDIQRFDPASRRFLHELLTTMRDDGRQRNAPATMGVVLAHDPTLAVDDDLAKFLSSALQQAEIREIPLLALEDREAEELLDGMLRPERLPGAVATALIERAGGLPGFLRDLVIEGRQAGPEDGTLCAALARGVPPRSVPPNVRALAVQQLSRATAEERQLIALLSDLPDGLTELEVRAAFGDPGVSALRGLIVRRALRYLRGRWRPVAEVFSQALREELEVERRQRAHDRVATALAQAGLPRYAELCLRLKGASAPAHLDEALITARRLCAAARYREEQAVYEAIIQLEAVAPFAARIARIHSARSLILAGRVSEAEDLLRPISPSDYMGMRMRAAAHRQRGDRAAALRRLEGLSRLKGCHSSGESAELWLDKAEIGFDTGQPEEAAFALQAAAAAIDHPLADRVLSEAALSADDLRMPWPGDFARPLARFLRVAARSPRLRVRQREAASLVRMSLKLASRLKDLALLGAAWGDLGAIKIREGQIEDAKVYLRRALLARRSNGDQRGVAEIENNLGITHRRRGQLEEAIKCFDRARALLERLGDTESALGAAINIASAELSQRELARARAGYEDVLERLSGNPNTSPRFVAAWPNLGFVATLEGRYQEADARYAESERRYRAAGQPVETSYAIAGRAEAAIHAGRFAFAEELIPSIEPGEDNLLHAWRARLHLSLLVRRGTPAGPAVAEAAKAARERVPQGDVATHRALDLLEAQAWLQAEAPDQALSVLGFDPKAADSDLVRFVGTDAVKSFPPELHTETLVVLTRALLGAGATPPTGLVSALEEAERVARHCGMPRVVHEASAARALLRQHQDRPIEAMSSFETALEALEAVLVQLQDDGFVAEFIAQPALRNFSKEVHLFAESQGDSLRPKLRQAAQVFSDEIRRQLFAAQRETGGARTEVLRREEFLRPLEELLRNLNSTKAERIILQELVETVVDYHRAERAFLLTIDARGEPRVSVCCSRDRQPIHDPEREISRNIVHKVLESGRSLRSDDAADDEVLNSHSVLELRLRSILCTPLRHGPELLGLIYVDNRARAEAFRDADLEMLELFSMAAAATLVNARTARQFARNEKVRLLARIAEDVAHQFNNLLTPIVGRSAHMLEMIEEGQLTAAIRRDLLIIQEAALAAATTIRRLQDHARVRKSGIVERVDLRRVLEDAIQGARSNAIKIRRRTGKPIEIEFVCVDELTEVMGDPVILHDLFLSLIFNAVDGFENSPRGHGTLRVSLDIQGSDVRIVVEDDGAGLSEELLERLFDPYFAPREVEDNGVLGMSQIAGHVARHHGSIDVQSVEGQGTRTYVLLPRAGDRDLRAGTDSSFDLEHLRPRRRRATRAPTGNRPADLPPLAVPPKAPAAATPVEAPPKATPTEAKGPPRPILVVDDDHGVLALMVDILERDGCEVTPARSAKEALEAFAQHEFKVVVSDIGMVPVDGWELARELKRLAPKTVILMISGWSARIDRAALEARGVDGLISKPFVLRQFLESVHGAFARARAIEAGA